MKFVLSENELVAALLQGAVGVAPTDTVYGLVARAQNPDAVAKLYALKQREHKPGTVIAANTDQLVELGVPEHHVQRVAHLWPNPLSIEIPLEPNLNYLHQETGRQAYRVVADLRMRRILEQTGPLLTSSANQPGQPGAVNLREAQDYFLEAVDFYMDGGDLSGRAPSTIIGLSNDGTIKVYREGAVRMSELTGQSSCPFCLSNGLFNGDILAESEGAYLTLALKSNSNYLIIPKSHVESVGNLPATWVGDVAALLGCIPELGNDYNLSMNFGKVAGQSVRHLHLWVIPRATGQVSSGKGLARLIDEANQE